MPSQWLAVGARTEEHVRELVTEQAALRQVATLVARESSPDQLFAAVTEQVARVFDVPFVSLIRYEPEGWVVAGSFSEGDREPFPIGFGYLEDHPGTIATVRQTGRPARVEDYAHLPGEIAAAVRAAGIHSTVASPIVVEGRLWGAMVVSSPRREPLPEDTEARLTDFTELVATAIANAESRAALAALAHEQAALRRVATLVASGGGPEPLFHAVADEVQGLFASSTSGIVRFEDDGTATTLGTRGGGPAAGTRSPVDPDFVMGSVRKTRRAARFDTDDPTDASMPAIVRETGTRSAVASPIVVEGEVWGAIGVGSLVRSLPPDTERRLADFTELVATAIANAESRAAVALLADEQAALRHVATMVAEGVSPRDLFEAVAVDVGRLLPVSSSVMGRYEPDGSVITVASWSIDEAAFPTGERWPTEGTNIAWMVLQTGRAARIDDFSAAADPIGVATREAGITSAVGSPIVVEGHLWGVMTAASTEGPLPTGTEARLASFTDLVATAIANAESQSELIASRARIVSAGDEARRRIERNLHDGTQQRLIALGLDLQRVRATIRADPVAQVDFERMERDLGSILEDLRELSRGLHPPLLSRAGLRPSLRALARRSPIPVQLDVDLPERPPTAVETGIYYVVSEALANAIKHSHASAIAVTISSDGARQPTLHATVVDDGVGGAAPSRGSGLIGLGDRVNALGGRFVLESPAGLGTRISVELPFSSLQKAGSG